MKLSENYFIRMKLFTFYEKSEETSKFFNSYLKRIEGKKNLLIFKTSKILSLIFPLSTINFQFHVYEGFVVAMNCFVEKNRTLLEAIYDTSYTRMHRTVRLVKYLHFATYVCVTFPFTEVGKYEHLPVNVFIGYNTLQSSPKDQRVLPKLNGSMHSGSTNDFERMS